MKKLEKILLASTCALGAVSITFISLFVWKTLNNNSGTFIVTWDLDNGSALLKEEYKRGEIPSYKGDTPTKEGTGPLTEEDKKAGKDEYTYSFKGWDKEFVPVVSDVTYKAIYNAHSYVTKISFKADTIDAGIMVGFNFTYHVDEQDLFVNWGDHTYSKHDETTIDDPGVYHIEHNYTNKIRKDFSILVYGSIASLSTIRASSVPLSLELSNTNTMIEALGTIEELISITIPSSVKIIKDCAFLEGMNLSKVTFEKDSQLETIGEYAFAASDLTSIIIPKSVKTMGAYSFSNCRNLTSVTFEEGARLEMIPNNAFQHTAITSIIIPESVKIIGDGAFSGIDLDFIVIPESVEIIGDGAFSGTDLASIIIPKSVKTIGGGAFSGCQSLSSIIFEEGAQLETINTRIFSKSSIPSIIIPKSVNTIKNYAFEECSSLSSVIFEEGSQLETIEEFAFNKCAALTSIIIPKSVNTIENYAFEECSSLSSVIFEEGSQLETIGDWSFDTCDLISVKIPKITKTIGSGAFDENENLSVIDLTEFTVPSIENIPRVESDSFPMNDSLKFYVTNDDMLATFTNESSSWYPYASRFTTEPVPTI